MSLSLLGCRVHEGRKSYEIQEPPQLSKERIVCIGSSRKRPVIKWENNVVWPGKLILTNKALYFQVFIVDCELNECHVVRCF